MDPLSDVLSLLRPHASTSGGIDIGGRFAIRFGRFDGIQCYAVLSGRCWLAVEGLAAPIQLETGDCLLLPSGRPFRLATDLSLPPVDSRAVLHAPLDGAIASFNGGGCLLAGGHFTFAGGHASILLEMLPPIVHIRAEPGSAGLRWPLERMQHELREPRPGGALIAQHLAHMALIQALRLHLAEAPAGGVGWLFALADQHMSAAIHSMHRDPARHWTVEELAQRAGMSRSSFALRFKETVGASPMDYLTRWRMMLAGDRLTNTGDPISAIAISLGYESESAFSTAFKRVMGCSPRQYGRVHRPTPHHDASRHAGHLASIAS